jgi:CRISPR/Cas system endoribonuclease Cas6 (RAMP superfamily)
LLESGVMVSRHRIETSILNFKQGSRQIGFVGEVLFGVQRGLIPPEAQAGLGLLAAFAFYSGVGIKTTTGMGMARATQE